MVSINTNLSSLIVQNNLQQSTNALNLAIERMTTGFKINHAADNAAGYSISQNMSSQISSYGVAQDNIASGMDMVTTAMDTITLMQSHGERVMALWTQAQNGTYGDQSLQAIQSEVNARMAEITRLYNTAEYNSISLFEGGIQLPDWAEEVKANAGANISTQSTGFIDDIVTVTPDVIVTDPTQLASAISSNSKIGIGDAATLRKLAELVNNGTNCSGKTIILTDDIDLNNEEWIAIGSNSSRSFKGTFDGQGHKVKNLKIDKEVNYQGLFGYAGSGSALKNVGVENVNIKGGNYTGGLAGYTEGAIKNSYATGSVSGSGDCTGGLAGSVDGAITNSYATGSVTGSGNQTGGLAGMAWGAITNSYATGSVTGSGNQTGGLAGMAWGAITNSYATGSVTGGEATGGLAGYAGAITNSYATGSVTGGEATGGLAGFAGAITNSYATGSVTGGNKTGGLVGYAYTITNSYATGSVSGSGMGTGGLAGYAASTITNSYATGSVTGGDETGGLVGDNMGTVNNVAYNKSANPDLDVVGSGTATNVTELECADGTTTLQVGINDGESNQISFDSTFSLDLNVSDISSVSTYDSIKSFLDMLSEKATQLGAVQNRLESALESTTVAVENLISSRSTLRDADIAKESSAYIKSQILQQASATLLATANQSPSIALQLI